MFGIFRRLLESLLKTGLSLMKIVLKSLGKTFSKLLGLTVAATTTTDATIQKKSFGSGITILTISKEEVNDIMKAIKSLKYADLLIKGVSETTENEAKGKKAEFLACYQVH